MEAQLMRLQDLRLKEGMSLEQLAELSELVHQPIVDLMARRAEPAEARP